MKKINITINGVALKVDEGTSILHAAKSINVHIPTLCHHEDLCISGNCRICVVEVNNPNNLMAACATPVGENMNITTNSHQIRQARKHILELLLTEHNINCIKCTHNNSCELQKLALEYRTDEELFISLRKTKRPDASSPSILRDETKCIRCTRCVRTCAELQGVNALTMAGKGNKTIMSTFMDMPMNEVVCTNCGQCINRCPTGALVERNYIEEVWDSIYDKSKHVVVQTAPATRVALGELFNLRPGNSVTGRMVSSLRRMGFDSVLDTDFTADLTIIEEGTELLHRLKKVLVDGDKSVALPMMTSCSPGWVKFIEHVFPELLPNLSTCKSPQQMFGALAKTFYADKKGLDPKDMISVSIMPCTAKKFEANRPEMRDSGFKDVDYVLTTRELSSMIRQSGIAVRTLQDENYDSIMGESTGAGVIFGVTGGVMEAAIRTVYELVTGREVPFDGLRVTPVRGMEGVKTASLLINDVTEEYKFLEGVELKVGIAHGLANARKLMNAVRDKTIELHFIEIMACPGGCIGGGGQPIPTNIKIRTARTDATYREDEGMKWRKSHENPEVKAIYEEFLGEPNGHKSHKLLHTYYTERKKY
ncbi:MAG: NADH-dependent [FeFe] hydrogenase, group A6 [Bacteroidales bacterium]|jgi:NADH-quinone oxidoreductase subunit G/[NiFe] hydrogenase diaphorase moiety small subunit/NADP-reducing hydrogenase subunit HndD|nr:NADH-dependent [FeFe] hydrogenase, group A6 [Bacteroidales bacterium]